MLTRRVSADVVYRPYGARSELHGDLCCNLCFELRIAHARPMSSIRHPELTYSELLGAHLWIRVNTLEHVLLVASRNRSPESVFHDGSNDPALSEYLDL